MTTDNQDDNLIVAHTAAPELREGDVALILRADGEPEIAHNITSLAETGQLVGGPGGNSAGIILALALMNILGQDEKALTASMVRVTGMLEGGSLRLVM